MSAAPQGEQRRAGLRTGASGCTFTLRGRECQAAQRLFLEALELRERMNNPSGMVRFMQSASSD